VVAGVEGDVVVAETAMHAVLSAERTLVRLDLDPFDKRAAVLVGERVGNGFRAAIAEQFRDDGASTAVQLLDDLPIAQVIAGYSWFRAASRETTGALLPAEPMAARMGDVCSGWRVGGTMLSSITRGGGLPLQPCPPAPLLVHPDDRGGWHHLPTLARGGMRRYRRIDVVPGKPAAIDAMFRDTHGEPDGTEVVLHEYALSAAVEDPSAGLSRIIATPMVLPAPECPLVAAYAAEVEGVPVEELATSVGERLTGIRSCTHLNDLLRSLAGLAALLDAAPEDGWTHFDP
jgi:hypothetical protein